MDNIYYKIYRDYAKQIQNGILRPHSKLPSENELAEAYTTSRETVRKGLNLLAQNGYIQKVKGKGSFVLPIDRFDFPVSGLVSFKELAAKMRESPVTRVVSLEASLAGEEIASRLKVGPDEPIWKVVRTRTMDGEAIILDKDWFLQSCVPDLTKEICEDSIYQYLEKTMDIPISFAKKVITVEEATEEDSSLLDLTRHELIVVVRNYVHLEDAQLFQYTESRHRPDKFRFVDFARRQ
ncbi:trehalose operon repressor [Salinithrix halophila]|uniref:Trehalose operon repressor n=1 Tax=Salinithrix halophila TaxID=1485204 RepID=A0ABV8JMZ1_9BACL